MKPVKYILFTIIFLSFVFSSSSAPVDIYTAETAGYNWLVQQYSIRGISFEISPFNSFIYIIKGNNVFYIFNYEPEGWVIVSAEDTVYPIIAYNTKGYLDLNLIKGNVAGFLNLHADSIIKARGKSKPLKETAVNWDDLLDNSFDSKLTNKAVEPLLSSNWDQDSPWNNMCPEDSSGPGGHVYAGCVAVAMSQIMRYWQHPAQGTGFHSYYHYTYGNISANFGNTTYDWQDMPYLYATSSSQELLFHAGVSVNMNYGPNGSGASSESVPSAMKAYFGYSESAQYLYRQDYSDTAWKSLLKNQLDSQKPVYYRGSETYGHAFVCDGYDSSDFFHFNWGWSGYADGYYNIDNLNPGGHNFSYYQAAIKDLVPEVTEQSNTPVFRFFNTVRGGHLYTISNDERDSVMQLPQWNYEGISFEVFETQEPATVAVYRFFNTNTGIHLYTISEDERDAVMQLPQWNYEGSKFWVYSTQYPGSIPVFRFFNHSRGGHLYTVSEYERDNVMQLPQWNYEGICFYVLPSGR